MTQSCIAVANFFIDKAIGEDKKGVSHLKLQKLLYIAYGIFFAYKGERLLDEQPEVWEYGPVFNGFYRVARDASGYRNSPIITPLKNGAGETPQVEDEDVVSLLRSVWKSYGKKFDNDLIGLCHVNGSPWDQAKKKAVKERGFLPRNYKIDDEIIKKYYQRFFKFPKPKN